MVILVFRSLVCRTIGFFSLKFCYWTVWILIIVGFGRLNFSDKTFFLWLHKYTRCGHLKWSNAQNWLINVTMSLLTDHVSGHTIPKAQCEHMQAHCCTIISKRERNVKKKRERREKQMCKSTTNSNSNSNNNNTTTK